MKHNMLVVMITKFKLGNMQKLVSLILIACNIVINYYVDMWKWY